MTLLAHNKMAHCNITSKHPYAPIQWQIELLESAEIIKYTMYTNVLIKNNKFVVELWHNWNNYGHNIEHNGWHFWTLLKSIIGKNLSIIGWGLLVLYNITHTSIWFYIDREIHASTCLMS